jgi:hypothetical protein
MWYYLTDLNVNRNVILKLIFKKQVTGAYPVKKNVMMMISEEDDDD